MASRPREAPPWRVTARFGLRAFALPAILAAFASVFLIGPAFAAPHIADFRLDMSRDELALRQTVACGDRLCGPVELGGLVWSGAFTLSGGRLSAIALSAPASERSMRAAIDAFAASPYVVKSVLTDAGVLVPSLADKTKEEAIASFLRRSAGEDLSFLSVLYGEEAGEDGEASGELSGEPSGEPSVGCCLTVDASGITLVIMDAAALARELGGSFFRRVSR